MPSCAKLCGLGVLHQFVFRKRTKFECSRYSDGTSPIFHSSPDFFQKIIFYYFAGPLTGPGFLLGNVVRAEQNTGSR